MKKLKIATIIVLILSLAAWIGLCLWAIFGGIEAGKEIAQEASNQGAENGSAVGGAIAGAAVGTLSIAFFILIGIVFGLFAFNTLIALIIYCLKSEHGVFGGILVLIFASPIAGIMIIVAGCIS